MATPINTILNWFLTGKRPTQQHFADSWNSFWHKSENIPVANIDGLISLLAPINNHLNDANAHGNLILKARTIPFGSFLIFKTSENILDTLEIGDVVLGFFNGSKFILAVYNGGDISDIANYSMLTENDL